MSKFITGKELESAVEKIFWHAKEELIIVSPYIKLDKHFKELFEKQLYNHRLHILLMFGKNEGRVNKSFSKADLEFFKQFPNISIIYIPNLHAKYYANERMGIVTSINLYDYSFKNNVEFGVLYENKILNRLAGNSDDEVWNTCTSLAEENAVVYINRPMYAESDYRKSKVLYDVTEALYKGKALPKDGKKWNEYEDELEFEKVFSERPTRDIEKPLSLPIKESKNPPEESFKPGFCIRTGIKIPFNPTSPYSYEAYKSWAKWNDEDFKEKHCHYSGEPSKGETSMRKPILHKNWKKASEVKK